MADTPDEISNRLVRSNYRQLITIYLELADDHSHDCVPFLSSLPSDRHDDAIRPIRTIWGTNNQLRRSSIEKSLFDYLQQQIPHEKLTGTLRRYVEIGYLTFDKFNPGYKHPAKKQQTMNEIVTNAEQLIAKRDASENAG